MRLNKRQKEVQQTFIDNEKAVLNKLKNNYADALSEINSKIELLMSRHDADMQHVIYQIEYQKSLKTQVSSILDKLQADEFETMSEYIANSYEEGFIGTMYDLQGQGIPLVFPIDQKQVVAAIQHETKLSESLYASLGKDIKDLSKKIAGEISRGISNAAMYSDIARNIAGYAGISRNKAMRIARTESHRIQCKATADAQWKAKENGADVVKQWDSSLDKRTRDSHVNVDGEIKELDEKFSNGLMYPGDQNGAAAEVINCRCALLQRARWALGNNYTKWSPDAQVEISDDGTTQFVNIEAKNYKDFKKQYKYASERVQSNAQKMNDVAENTESGKIIFKEAKNISQAKKYAEDALGFFMADYDKLNLEAVNMINREITNIYNVFGNLNEKERLEGIMLWTKKANWYAAYSSSSKVIGVKNLASKDVLSKLKKDAKVQFELGFWSTDNAEHFIRHEAGHAIQHMISNENLGKINKIDIMRKEIMKDLGINKWDISDSYEHKKSAGKVISYYALRNEGEFIAESVAEYMAGKPRETAKKVVEILLEKNPWD